MPHAVELTSLLEHRYGARVAGLCPYFEMPEKGVYRVDRHDGPPWVARLFPSDRPLERVLGDAAIHRHVEQRGIAAERLVAATDGALATELAGRGVLVTQVVRGVRLDRYLRGGRHQGGVHDALTQLGEVVGRLHALLPVPAADPYFSRRAGSLPREDLALGRSCLARVADIVPADLVDGYLSMKSAIEDTDDCEGLSAGFVHPDGHIANALFTSEGQVVLIDWDGAGQGPRVAALGLLLFTSAVQAASGPSNSPDFGRVEAVLEGYLRHYVPSRPELSRLPDAVRVRALVICARKLAAGVEHGAPSSSTGWWTRWREAEAVAARATEVIEQKL